LSQAPKETVLDILMREHSIKIVDLHAHTCPFQNYQPDSLA